MVDELIDAALRNRYFGIHASLEQLIVDLATIKDLTDSGALSIESYMMLYSERISEFCDHMKDVNTIL
jgi:hypothetical protein